MRLSVACRTCFNCDTLRKFSQSCLSGCGTFLGACRSCKAWAEKLVGISDVTTLTAADKAKIKEEYGLWEQKTGINAKEGGVGILGIRTRQLMHERRLELLEALRDKPCELCSAYVKFLLNPFDSTNLKKWVPVQAFMHCKRCRGCWPRKLSAPLSAENCADRFPGHSNEAS